MINISDVFKINGNLIFALNEPHKVDVGSKVTDNNGNVYEVLSVVFETNDLYVKPLSKDINLKSIKNIKLALE